MSNIDSHYATDKINQRSVTGILCTLAGMLISWASKTQPSVTLSSGEAEYTGAAPCCQEILIAQMLFREIKYSVDPAIIFEDNTGAIDLVKNQQVSQRTRHHCIMNGA